MAKRRIVAKKPTLGKRWREIRERGVVLELPSSTPEHPRFARLRAVGPDLMIRLGKVPDSLTNIIADMVEKGTPNFGEEDRYKGVTQVLELAEAVCECSFLEPRIVEHPENDDEISLEDLTLEDKLFVIGFFGQPITALEKFREEQIRRLESISNESKGGEASERNHGDQTMGS